MKRLSLLTLIFAVLSLVFVLILIFLRIPFPLYPLVSYQDVFSILTPFLFIPIYWLLFKYAAKNKSSLGQEIVFIVLALIWVEGQGIHLSANSINNLIGALARQQVIDITASDIYRLTYFFRRALELLSDARGNARPGSVIDLARMLESDWKATRTSLRSSRWEGRK